MNLDYHVVARIGFSFLLWIIGFSSQYYGMCEWTAPRWLMFIMGIWKSKRKISFEGALFQLLALESLVFLKPIYGEYNQFITGGIILTALIFINIGILRLVLQKHS